MFFADFRKLAFFFLNFFSIKKNQRNFFGRSLSQSLSQAVTHSLPPLRGGCQERGVAIRWKRLRCTRLQHRTCKTSRGNFASHGLSAHGLSTERARLARGTSPRSWVQKKCLLPGGILIFFFQKIPDFENSNLIFFHLKKFLKFFGEIRRIIFI